MENKIMQLFMEKGEVSMNNDIFPILFEEFGNAPLNEQTYAMASDFISQQLYAVYAAGIKCCLHTAVHGSTADRYIICE